MTGLPEVSLFETSLDGASLCLRLLRCDRCFWPGCAVALRSALKKSRKGPASATSVAVNRVKIDNQMTIVCGDRFTIRE